MGFRVPEVRVELYTATEMSCDCRDQVQSSHHAAVRAQGVHGLQMFALEVSRGEGLGIRF